MAGKQGAKHMEKEAAALGLLFHMVAVPERVLSFGVREILRRDLCSLPLVRQKFLHPALSQLSLKNTLAPVFLQHEGLDHHGQTVFADCRY